jgi:hypothetical protein
MVLSHMIKIPLISVIILLEVSLMLNLAWYWWVLILIGLGSFIYMKVVVGGKILKKWNKPKTKSSQKD